jgi:GNAT superfamily N-acetyltransferase
MLKEAVDPQHRDIAFRPMRHADIDGGLRLCRLAGWDQVRRDWQWFLEGPDTSAIAAVDQDKVVATSAAIRYGTRFGWIGMVLVHPDAQGRGVGAAVLQQAIDQLSDMPSIRLDATPAGRLLYQKHDFVDEYPLMRMESTSVSASDSARTVARPMTRGELSEVATMDAAVFGAPRANTLEWMYDGAPEFAFVAERAGNLCGYLLGRHGHQFEHLGPVVADDVSDAIDMVRGCLARHRDQSFVIDAPHHSRHWIRFLEDSGFHAQRPYVRMYRGGRSPFGQPQNEFAVLGPEFG